MTRVLFVISHLSGGGAERALANLTMHWPNEYEIDILCNNISGNEYEHKGNIISLGLDDGSVSSLIYQAKVLISRIRTLRSMKRENKYSACISFMDSANVANILSGHNHCKTIISVRQSLCGAAEKFWYYKWIVNPLVKMFYNRADAVVAVSEELKQEMKNYYQLKRVEAIPNGYDIAGIVEKADIPVDVDIAEEAKYIFTAGRLDIPKNHWHLIRAMKRVIEYVPNARLYIAGKGELYSYLQELILNLKLQESIKLLGFKSNVYNLEKVCDVYVMPSGWEGFPNALAEAMCVGAPVVVTDFKTGAREIVYLQKLTGNFLVQKQFLTCVLLFG